MNFQSLTFFKKNKAEPGSYPYRNRFLKSFKNLPLENCMGTRCLPIQEPVPECIFPVFHKFSMWNPVPPTGNRFPRVAEPFPALLTAFIHSQSNPNLPIRISTWETLKHIQFASLSHQTTYFHHSYLISDTLNVF